MLKPLDRHRRDSTLFQFTSRRMRDFIDPDHLLIRIDEQFDFAKLAAPLEDRYCPDNGRPAIHPEVMIRALIICSLYNISSFRRLSSAIGENLAYRWFCFLTIDDPVFDHSTVSYFIERAGREGFAAIFRGLNEELLRLGLLSPEMYADSSLVKANVNSHQLSRSGLTVAEFRERAIEGNGLFVLNQFKTDENGVEWEETRHFQDSKGHLPLNPVDTDARWRTSRPGKPPGLNYQDNAVVDRGGFILSRGVTYASEGEWKALPALLEQLPLQPITLTADTAYSAGRLRDLLERKGVTAYIPIHPVQESNMVARGGFEYRGDHVVCSQGKILKRAAYHRRNASYQYVALQKDCQACPIKEQCLPPRQKRRYLGLSIYYPLHLQAQERNRTPACRREMARRRTIVEGVFASLDRLGWARSRLRGLWKVDCEGFVASITHNLLKALRRLARGVGPLGPGMSANHPHEHEVASSDDPSVGNAVLQPSMMITSRPQPEWRFTYRLHTH